MQQTAVQALCTAATRHAPGMTQSQVAATMSAFAILVENGLVGPDSSSPPHHPTHFETSLLEWKWNPMDMAWRAISARPYGVEIDRSAVLALCTAATGVAPMMTRHNVVITLAAFATIEQSRGEQVVDATAVDAVTSRVLRVRGQLNDEEQRMVGRCRLTPG